MERKEIFDRLIPLIIKADFKKSISNSNEIENNSNFEKDLGFDSIDKTELLMFSEKEFNIIYDYPDVSSEIDTVDDLINLIQKYQ